MAVVSREVNPQPSPCLPYEKVYGVLAWMKYITPERRSSEIITLKRVNILLWALAAALTLYVILGGLK